MADRPLRPAIDRRLGELLPHQLANLTQAHLLVGDNMVKTMLIPHTPYGESGGSSDLALIDEPALD